MPTHQWQDCVHSGGVLSSRQTSTFPCTALPLEPGRTTHVWVLSSRQYRGYSKKTTNLGDVQDGDSEDYYNTTATGVITKEPGAEEATTNVAASDETITDESDGNESATEEEKRIKDLFGADTDSLIEMLEYCV